MKLFILIVVFTAMVVAGKAGDALFLSKWDQALLNTEFHDVHVKTNTMVTAFEEMSTKYLLRANIYLDAAAYSDSTTFGLNKKTATGEEIIEAFLDAYPEYTYTHDPDTGVIWFHPKRVRYDSILNQKVKSEHAANQIPVYTQVLMPLNALLFPNVNILSQSSWGREPVSWCYCVNMPAGDLSVRQILNLCSTADPTKAFEVGPQRWSGKTIVISCLDLIYANPLTLPRATTLKFWEIEIGKCSNGIPSFDEVVTAMSDYNPRKRWAAWAYQEADQMNYPVPDLINKSSDSEKVIWVVLGVENTLIRGSITNYFDYIVNRFPRLANDLSHIQDPRLALLASLELTKEKHDASFLNTIVSGHKYSEAEIASIKPDLIRIARQSKLARDKLSSMKFDDSDLSPEGLHELENTNLFSLVPIEKN
jgi:hypothetical protein